MAAAASAPSPSFDCSAIATRIAAQVKDFQPEDYLDRKESKRMDRFVQFAVAASQMAVQDAGLSITDENRARVGVFIGSGIGGIATLEEQHTRLMEGGMGRVCPVLRADDDRQHGHRPGRQDFGRAGAERDRRDRLRHQRQLPRRRLTTASSAATPMSIIAGGSEAAITPISMAGFSNMRAMSRRNDDPEHASRPFDEGRDGFLLGEGSAILILEELSVAQARGARIYAEIIGYGMSNDAYDLVAPAPDGAGAARAMTAALKSAAIAPDAIGYINAHGTSTPAGDVQEVHAIKTVFGDHAYKLAVSSTKSMTGHLLGAAGAVEAIATALALQNGILPPTMNLDHPDPQCDLDFVPNKAREQQVDLALSNSFGFGGHNATLVLKRWTGE